MTPHRTSTTEKSPQRTFRILFGAVVWLCAFISASFGATQYGAQTYSGGTSTPSYGSVGYGSLGLNFSDGYSPATSNPLIAQNTPVAPATLTPVASATTTLTPPPVVSIPPTATTLTPIDPYAMPNNSSAFPWTGALGTSPSPSGSTTKVYSGNMEQFFPETYQAMRRFREAISINFTSIPAGSKSEWNYFGVNELDFRMQLGFPCRFIPNSGPGCTGPGFFYVAPGGSLLWWDGPDTDQMNGAPRISPNGFSASLDVGMTPQFNETFSLDAWFRLGVFSDFKEVTSHSLRYQGRLAGMFNVSNQFKIVAGVLYLDRARLKLLPTGGVIWTPREDLVLRLTFPNPKLSMRISNTGRAEWWGYVQGDYGGGSWTMDGVKTDYNDIRIGAGIEFETLSKVGGFFEVGGAFNREIYSYGDAWCTPKSMVYLKTGFVF